MLKQLRTTIIKNLLANFHHSTTQLSLIEKKLKNRGTKKIILDHLALIDLPGPNSGINQLSQIFSCLGYLVQGRDYLPDKQNAFLWMTEIDSIQSPAEDVLPQIVVADFHLDELPLTIKKIIEKYSYHTPLSPLADIQKLMGRVYLNDSHAAQQLILLLNQYLKGRDWSLPTLIEFSTVAEFNPLLAWVLVFGRRPNHFTLSVHLLNQFSSLQEFLQFIEQETALPLNTDGGILKGNKKIGVEQGSTMGTLQCVKLADGEVTIPSEFVEFIWRFPHASCAQQPYHWEDYHVGFIPQHANQVIESLVNK